MTQARSWRRYLGPSMWSTDGERTATLQGGYTCSVRAWTEYENEDFILDSPNYYSRYMNTKVTLLIVYRAVGADGVERPIHRVHSVVVCVHNIWYA